MISILAFPVFCFMGKRQSRPFSKRRIPAGTTDSYRRNNTGKSA